MADSSQLQTPSDGATPANPHLDRWLAGGLLLSTALIYAPLWALPFTQDDWVYATWFQQIDAGGSLGELVACDRVNFRPLSNLLLYGLYQVFGTTAIPYRVVNLLLLLSAAFLTRSVLQRLTGDRRVGCAVAFLSAGAAAVHMDSMAWAVGMQNLGAHCFGMLAVLCAITRRPWTMALAFALAAGFREAAIAVPVACAVVTFALPREQRLPLRSWLPLAAVLAAYVLAKLQGQRIWDDPDDAYAASLFGPHLFHNALLYAKWTFRALVPATHWLPTLLAVGVFAAALPAVALAARRRLPNGLPLWGLLLVLLTWAAIELGPALVLVHHSLRPYLSSALPAALGAVVVILVLAGDRLLGRRLAGPVLAVGTALCLLMSADLMRRTMQEKLDGAAPPHGTVVWRARLTELVRDTVLAVDPPKGATLAFAGVELVAFGYDAGPRAWLGDPTVAVHDAAELTRTAHGVHQRGATAEPIAPDRLLLFALRNGGLQTMSVDELPAGR